MSKKNKKRKPEEEKQSPVDWEEENIFPEKIKNEMESMWEIPQIFQFLHLAKEALNIPHLSMYEMERMLLIPRASKQLANIMTSLLSSPMTKAKLRKIPPMPYEFWTNILAYKMKSWFKVYEAKHQDAVKVLETIGVEPQFWNIFPDAPLLNGKDFEELTFRQKVWLLKTVCDTVMHTRKTVQEEIAKQPLENQFETVLGTDRYGARYIYFPQFLKSDLRVYRHCLDNKILSTVKVPSLEPIKPKSPTNPESNPLDQNNLTKKQSKRRKRRSRWSNGLPPKLRRRGNEKHSNDCKCNSDSATSSLMNEDTNSSSISACSNNNNSCNNNNVNPNTINVKRSRSLSKCSEISTESDKTYCTKSSGYDTNRSVDTLAESKLSQRMFKGFSNSSDITDKECNMQVINGILNNLKSKFDDKKGTEGSDVELGGPQDKLESTSTKQQYLDTIVLCVSKGEPVDRTIDNLCSVSKTDDEKLNEIISTESLKLNEKNHIGDAHQMSTSKSDDEKLNETRISCDESKENVNFSDGKDGNEVTKRANGQFKKKSNNFMINEQTSKRDNEIESNEDKDLSLSELRCILQKEAMDDKCYLDDECKVDYNHRNLDDKRSDVWKQEVDDFNEMLLELSSSKFQLVADSVSSLRNLISTFSQKDSNAVNDTDGENGSVPPCEAKLVKEMTELLASVEKIESAIRESTRRARGKLQKEWTNFKEGSAEDQDSSGEGLGSNWWVLGSQNCPLSTAGDTTLQALPQSTLSPTGSQNVSSQGENRQEDQHASHIESDKGVDSECKEPQGESRETKTQRGRSEGDEDNGQENAETKGEAKEGPNQEELQSGRVLRARGVSSYTFYSDDEAEENELEEWADVEAVYAAPNTPTDSSTPCFAPKVRNADDRTNEEDSDQDWILPSSRKRKNKRPSASRRLKSFQHKLQSIKIDAVQNAAESAMATPPANVKNQKPKPKIKEIQISKPGKPTDSKNHDAVVQNATESHNAVIQNAAENHDAVIQNAAESQDTVVQNTTESHDTVVQNTAENHDTVVQNACKETVPSVEINCKIENVESVHSELDIKDEGPIYDCAINQCDNGYSANFNPNYVMFRADQNPMNYYVMQPNPMNVATSNAFGQPSPVLSNIISPVQQSYYVQGGQNYIIQNPQSNFIPSQPFQPQGPQMIAPQQFINHSNYVPYMLTPSESHPEYVPVNPHAIAPQEMPQNLSMYVQPAAVSSPPRPQQNRYPVPRQNPHPHGAVIRSSMPIRGSFPRANSARTTKSIQQPRNVSPRIQKPRKQTAPSEVTGQKTTSLIVLSDSDDEIEMIITEKASSGTETEKAKTTPRKSRQSVTGTSNDTSTSTKSTISPQIIQRMSQGGISITPIKPAAPPVQNASTQLVVVVNDTGSHYALALPNGSKLILTPEQVAQIRASNGGKLIL